MGTFFGLAQSELSAANDHFDLVVDPVANEAVDTQGTRHAVDQGQHVRAEVLLKRGELVKVVQHNAGNCVALEHDH